MRIQAESVGSVQTSLTYAALVPVEAMLSTAREGQGVAPASCPQVQETGARRHKRVETGWSAKKQEHASTPRA